VSYQRVGSDAREVGEIGVEGSGNGGAGWSTNSMVECGGRGRCRKVDDEPQGARGDG